MPERLTPPPDRSESENWNSWKIETGPEHRYDDDYLQLPDATADERLEPASPEPQLEADDAAAAQELDLEAARREVITAYERHEGTDVSERLTPSQAQSVERTRWAEHPLNPASAAYVRSENLDGRVVAAERVGGLPAAVREINNEGGPGREINCGECARAVADTVEGRPHSADAIEEGHGLNAGEPLDAMEQWSGEEFREPEHPEALRALVEDARTWQEGEQAIVAVEWKSARERMEAQGIDVEAMVAEADPSSQDDLVQALDETAGHYVNIVRTERDVVLVDAQAGTYEPADQRITELIANSRATTWMKLGENR